MQAWHEHQIELQPQQPLEDTLKQLPGRWCVYLMSDADDRPVQMLAVKNLRASVKRRFSEDPDDTLTKRVDYRAVVRNIRYRRVDSALECDLAYLDAARQAFPQTYRQLLTLRQTWFVHVDPGATFPRWTRVEDPRAESGVVIGPIQEKGQAQKLIESIEDAFDLCRYHNILVQSPDAAACPYKEMGRCPAPCDGSVSMQQYRALVDWSAWTMIDPDPEIEQQTSRMQHAAAELRFETAAKIRQFVEQLGSLRHADYRFARPMRDFRYLSLQPGPRKGHAKLFAITPAGAECVACLRGEPTELMLRCESIEWLSQPLDTHTIDAIDYERLSIAVKHLFSRKPEGLFLQGGDLTDRALASAYKQLTRRDARPDHAIDDPNEDEGVVTESTLTP